MYEAFINWGNYLGNLAKLKMGNDAEALYVQAFEKFQKAIDIKPDNHSAFINWGNYLGNLAKINKGKDAEAFYTQAFEKYQKAIDLKPNDHEVFNIWGIYLGYYAQTKEGKDAEDLYIQAFEKLKKSIKYGGSSYNLSCLFALKGDKENALKNLELCLSTNGIEVDFVEKDEDWRSLFNDEDFINILNKYK
ncbi:MAG: hypothetical protein IPO85_12040 [Saprospiraceae bacterium]|uniref:Tetratricopeptide repeat protein n=1 Tax=Candidatus Defluviibacterium haderslevense TaxID=2981993 RepID=A0A9D7SAQ1_9BACT|nr:hypothetical protein [Candidatus Defluviibacterium haderslevense]